jgi:phosphoribosylformylglycinamidine synthase PurS subunit
LYLSKIRITLRKSILDPQGKAVEHSIESLGYKNIKDTRIGKYIELTLEAASEADARKTTEEVCKKLLANPVMEDYDFEILNLNGTSASNKSKGAE